MTRAAVVMCLLTWFVGIERSVVIASGDLSREAQAAFQSQMAAWNRGDLEGALTFYRNGPDMTWVNRQGISRGFAPFADDMRKSFARHPELMGTYSGEVLDARTISKKNALLVVKWSIVREGKRLMGGISTQLWQRNGREWRVILEHAS